jgi:hypothetical protein
MVDQPPSLGSAQWSFIKKTRVLVKNDPKVFFANHNWHNINPTGGKNDGSLFNGERRTTIDDFYVRPIICWVPHLLIRNHVPSCPRCKDKDNVDVIKARWI